MGAISRYWQLVRIDAAGQRKVDVVPLAQTLVQEQFAPLVDRDQVSDVPIQRQLYQLMHHPTQLHADTDAAELAELSLRCFTSHIIEQACIQLEAQFGRQHGFTRLELFPFVLDESPNLSKGGRPSQTGSYQTLSQTIVHSFNPDQGNLATWTTRLVRRHHGLNAVLLEYGVYLVSDWAILNDTTLQQVERILAEFHTLSETEIGQARCLLESYHGVYRRDRLQHRSTGSAGRCHAPTIDQLQQMIQRLLPPAVADRGPMTPEAILNQLKTLAEQLRQYRIYIRGGPAPSISLDQPISGTSNLPQLAPPPDDQGSEAQNEFLAAYRQQFQTSLDQAISAVLSQRFKQLQRRQPLKAHQYLQALYLFHCRGQAMGEIAPQVNLKAQYQVSRLLQLKELRAAIRHQILLDLRDRVLDQAQAYADPARLQLLDRQIDTALQAQIDQILAEAAAEASVPHHRPVHSLYAQRLCAVLDRRLDP